MEEAAPFDPGFEALREKITRDTGWDLRRFKQNYLRRRVLARMRSLALAAWGDYAAFLDASPGEYEKLKDRLTVNVTEFFRDADVYEHLGAEVLPALMRGEGGRPPRELRVWSAGCSSGEEPYSLAILYGEASRRMEAPPPLRLMASDLDEAVLARAREGRYPKAAVARLPAGLREQYFAAEGDEVRAGEALRAAVVWRQHNLFADAPPSPLDMVLCRNVMIYFSRELQQRLLQAFHKALRPGGIFVTGKTETVLGPARQLFRCVSPRTRVFQKV